MKQILCYGDSNTWGYDTAGGGRFPYAQRFTGILAGRLPDCLIIEEGMNGRTAVAHDDLWPQRAGIPYLPVSLYTHRPLDLVILMLGTNDTKAKFGLKPAEIAAGMEEMIRIIRSPLLWHSERSPEILVVSPVEVSAHVAHTEMGGEFDETSAVRSQGLAQELAPLAARYGCHFLDAREAAKPCALDGVHLDAAGHLALADALERKIREILA